jgi:hypothetical protein
LTPTRTLQPVPQKRQGALSQIRSFSGSPVKVSSGLKKIVFAEIQATEIAPDAVNIKSRRDNLSIKRSPFFSEKRHPLMQNKI